MMRHVAPLGHRRLGGADVHAAIQRHRIERNDFGVDPPRQFDADRRFAGRRGAGEIPGGLRQSLIDRAIRFPLIRKRLRDYRNIFPRSVLWTNSSSTYWRS